METEDSLDSTGARFDRDLCCSNGFAPSCWEKSAGEIERILRFPITLSDKILISSLTMLLLFFPRLASRVGKWIATFSPESLTMFVLALASCLGPPSAPNLLLNPISITLDSDLSSTEPSRRFFKCSMFSFRSLDVEKPMDFAFLWIPRISEAWRGILVDWESVLLSC